MDIGGADRALVAQLVNRGLVRDAAELYSLKLAEVAALEGRGRDFAKVFLEAIAASKSREAWRVLYGLSIPLVDVEVASQLCRQFAALDDILPAGPERMMQTAVVAEAVARSIAQWYGDGANRRLVRRLQKAGVNFKTGT
jgi:DNA ligase (NAD+)